MELNPPNSFTVATPGAPSFEAQAKRLDQFPISKARLNASILHTADPAGAADEMDRTIPRDRGQPSNDKPFASFAFCRSPPRRPSI